MKKRPKVITKYERHKRLYMLIQGAVIDAFNQHPEYLTQAGKMAAVTSITKRVTGLVLSNPQHVQGDYKAPDDSLK